MASNKAYSVLSKIYDRLMEDVQINWANHIVELLNANAKGHTGLDLACGSGYFTRAIKRNGYDVTGVDISPEMLTLAQELSSKERLNINYLNQDISKLKVFKKVDFLTIINDGVNYIDPESLQKAFKAFYASLVPSGVLIFDFSSEYKLKNVIGNNLFGEDYEDFSYLWFNKLYENKIEMDLTIFTKVGDLYKKEEETHIQYIHSLDFILNSLKKAGFTKISVNGVIDGFIDEKTQRMEIVAVK